MGFFDSLVKGATGFLSGGSWMGSLLGAGLGMLSGEQSNSANLKAMREQNDFNAKESEKQRQWQSDEWDKQFKAQTNEWYNQAAWQADAQRQEWQYQFDQQNAYNAPTEQVKRLQSAGINPAVLAGNAGGLSPAPAAPPAPSPATPSGGAVQGAAASGGQAPQMKSFGDFVDAFASASMHNAQANEVTTLLSVKAANMLKEGQILEHRENILRIDALNKEIFTKKQYQLLEKQVDEADKKITLLAMQGEVEAKKIITETYLGIYQMFAADLKGKKLQLFTDTMQLRIQEMQSYIDNLDADTRNKNAQATSAEFWNGVNAETRKSIISRIEDEAIMVANDSNVSTETKSDRIDQIRAYADMARYSNDNKEIAFWADVITNGVNAGANLVGEFTKFKSFKALNKTQKDNVSARIREIEERNKPRRTITHKSKNDDGSTVTETLHNVD